jgi:hypothetical protein
MLLSYRTDILIHVSQDEEAVEGAEAVERAVSGGGYESDNDDTDAAMQLRAQSSGQPTAAIIALAAAPNGFPHPFYMVHACSMLQP